MHHAIGAFLVVASPIFVPRGVLNQLLEGLRVAFAEQIAGALPAEHGAGWVPPRSAVIALIAGEEVEEQPRLVKGPSSLALASEDVSEQLLRSCAIKEVLLVRCALIGVARRNCDSIDAKRRNIIEKARHALGVGIAK